MATEPTSVQIRGARVNNLDNLDADIPLGKLTVLSGPSGTGKSSLAMHTLVAEGKRRLLALMQGPRLPRPDVDAILHLPPTIGVPASAPPGSGRGRCLDATELGGLIRALYRRHGAYKGAAGQLLHAHPPSTLVQQLLDRAGPAPGPRATLLAPLATPAADGVSGFLDELRIQGFARLRINGKLRRIDDLDSLPPGAELELVVDRTRISADKRARLVESLNTALLAGRGRILVDLEGEPELLAMGTIAWDPDTGERWPLPTDRALDWEGPGACPSCEGAGCDDCGQSGLGPIAHALTLGGWSFAALSNRPLHTLPDWLRQVPTEGVVIEGIFEWLRQHMSLGLGHLKLGRDLKSLGSGERARLRLLRAAHDAGPGQLLVIDEPCARLGPHQRDALARWLMTRRDRGATLVVVDHAPTLVAQADWELGFAPDRSGRLAHAGPPLPRAPWPAPRPRPSPPPTWTLSGVRVRDGLMVDLHLARGSWTTLCGPSGAGKSRLLLQAVAPALAGGQPTLSIGTFAGPLVAVRQIERVSSTRNPRSCVATHCQVWTPIRDMLARTREARVLGLRPEHFSFNRTEGQCSRCSGTGVETVDLGPLGATDARCSLCEGGRFNARVAEVRWRGRDIAGLLRMSASEGAEVFSAVPHVGPALQSLVTVGLGYLPLGRSTRSLSTGETQRLHLARLLTEGRRVARDTEVVLLADGVDVGLSDLDADVLRGALSALREEGHTLVTVSYHPALAEAADCVVVLDGPEQAR